MEKTDPEAWPWVPPWLGDRCQVNSQLWELPSRLGNIRPLGCRVIYVPKRPLSSFPMTPCLESSSTLARLSPQVVGKQMGKLRQRGGREGRRGLRGVCPGQMEGSEDDNMQEKRRSSRVCQGRLWDTLLLYFLSPSSFGHQTWPPSLCWTRTSQKKHSRPSVEIWVPPKADPGSRFECKSFIWKEIAGKSGRRVIISM